MKWEKETAEKSSELDSKMVKEWKEKTEVETRQEGGEKGRRRS